LQESEETNIFGISIRTWNEPWIPNSQWYQHRGTETVSGVDLTESSPSTQQVAFLKLLYGMATLLL
jgi:hypothetical protein